MRKRQLAWGAIPAVALAGQIERHWVAGPWSRIDFHIYYDAVSSMHSTPPISLPFSSAPALKPVRSERWM